VRRHRPELAGHVEVEVEAVLAATATGDEVPGDGDADRRLVEV
jgi:hypothetical protein